VVSVCGCDGVLDDGSRSIEQIEISTQKEARLRGSCNGLLGDGGRILARVGMTPRLPVVTDAT
jgi:hypothetical protein